MQNDNKIEQQNFDFEKEMEKDHAEQQKQMIEKYYEE